jgi:hypothetical protein
MAGLMAALMLVMTLVASLHGHHQDAHHDANAPHSQCAICSIHQGKLDAPQSVVSVVAAPVSIVWTAQAPAFSPKCEIAYSPTVSRGPPAVIPSV